MAGTREGGLKAAQTNKERHGADFYAKAGAIGGKAGTTGGFHYAKLNLDPTDPRHPANAGRKGGYISRKGSHAVERI